jgi:hypothetical protein
MYKGRSSGPIAKGPNENIRIIVFPTLSRYMIAAINPTTKMTTEAAMQVNAYVVKISHQVRPRE